jgi:signal transduction histidine kinase
MLRKPTEADRFGEIFPHMENILQCGLYTFGFNRNETTWSPGMFAILGIPPYSIDCTFENFSKYIVAEDRASVIEAVKNSREKRQTYKLEFGIVDARGKYKRVYAENAIFQNEDEQSVVYEGVIKDITESYFYKKALEQKVIQLDKSNQNLQEFVYIASHDLQEPLRKISTFIGRLSSRFENQLGEEGNMYVNRILSSSNNMQTLLEDLLSFSRLSFTDKSFEKVLLQEVLKNVLSDLEIKIEESNATIHSDPLPDILGYPTQVKQLFSNLLSNAIKFRKKDIPLVINIACKVVQPHEFPKLQLQKDSEYLKLDFTDNGIGFEQEFAEKIFMVFQRLNGKSEYAGSGIGLSICKRIVENHQGVIYATSSPGHGATFTVLLPYHKS